MADFIRADLRGSRFERADLRGAQFRAVGLWPLVDAELGRWYPHRSKMRPADRAGFREAWDILGRLWGETAGRARRVQPELLHESVDAVLDLRRDRMSTVRQVIEGLTDASLDGRTEPVDGPGWPEPRSYPVRECLLCILNEEWEHRLYAERDLDALERGR